MNIITDSDHIRLAIEKRYKSAGKRYVEGYAAMTGVDRTDVALTDQALQKAEKDLQKNVKLYLEHRHDEVIGKVVDVEFDEKGLWVKCFVSKTEDKIWAKIEEGVLNTFSIGFRILENGFYEKYNEETEQMLIMVTNAEFYDVSLVGLPANANAKVISHYVKKSLMEKDEDIFKASEKKARGEGQGQGNEPVGDGGADFCKCVECDYEMGKEKGIPCTELQCPKCGSEMKGINKKQEKAEWSTQYINDLPDSSFAVIEPAYKEGKTEDKRARHLPFKTKEGNVDMPHYRNALARVNQIKPITDSISTEELRKQAKETLDEYRHLLDTYVENEEKSENQGGDNMFKIECKECDYSKELEELTKDLGECPECGSELIKSEDIEDSTEKEEKDIEKDMDEDVEDKEEDKEESTEKDVEKSKGVESDSKEEDKEETKEEAEIEKDADEDVEEDMEEDETEVEKSGHGDMEEDEEEDKQEDMEEDEEVDEEVDEEEDMEEDKEIPDEEQQLIVDAVSTIAELLDVSASEVIEALEPLMDGEEEMEEEKSEDIDTDELVDKIKKSLDIPSTDDIKSAVRDVLKDLPTKDDMRKSHKKVKKTDKEEAFKKWYKSLSTSEKLKLKLNNKFNKS